MAKRLRRGRQAGEAAGPASNCAWSGPLKTQKPLQGPAGAPAAGLVGKLLARARRLGRKLAKRFGPVGRARPQAVSARLAWRPGTAAEDRPRLAVVLDPVTRRGFEPELRLVPLSAGGWRDALTPPVDALLVGLEALGDPAAGFAAGSLRKLTDRCRSHGIPSACWIAGPAPEEARLFDHVFTVDETAVAALRQRLGHDRVDFLPFAAQPLLHHPFGGGDRPRRPGIGWMAGGSLPPAAGSLADLVHRRGMLDVYADPAAALPEGWGAGRRDSPPWTGMPGRFRRHVAFLSPDAGGGGDAVVPRQAFEILACGTPVIAPPASALAALPGAAVIAAGDSAGVTRALRTLIGEPTARDRLAQRGCREVQARHTFADRAETVLAALGRPAVLRARPLVSLICVSHRPHFLDHALANLRRQTYPELEILFVLNGDGFDRAEVEARLAGLPRARCLVGGAQLTLAHGLNMALDVAAGDYLAKIDDDDDYGPDYIADGVLAAGITGADIVGKRSHYCYLEALDTLVIRYPGSENRTVGLVQGATILAARRVVEQVRFTPVRQGTDTIFLKRCVELGFSLLSTDRFNFVYRRRLDPRDHTWAVGMEAFLRTCEVVGPGLDLDRVFV